MPRASKTHVTGLSRLTTGPRAGRLALNFRHRDATGKVTVVQKLYPKDWPMLRVKRDAGAIIDAVLSGTYQRRAPEPETRVTIATLAERVIDVYASEKDRAPASLKEFRSVIAGTPTTRPGGRTGGHVVRHLGHLAPHELTRAVLASFVDTLRAEGLSPLTIRNVMKALGMFCKIVRVRELDPKLTFNPLADAFEAGLVLPSKRREAPVFLSLEEAGLLLASAPEPRRLRYALALFTGLRDGEIAGLTWDDIDLAAGVLRVRRACAWVGGLRATKTAASERDVPIHADLAWRLRLAAGVGPVFAVGGKAHRPPSARLLRADLLAVGIDRPELTFHGLRRSFASWLEAADVAHETIERLMGHEPRSVLGRHYAATAIDTLRAAVSRLVIPSAGPVRAMAAVV